MPGAVGAAARVAAVVGAGVIAGGALGVLAGGNIVRESLPKIAKDYERGNLEGGINHAGDAFIGASYTTVAAGMVVGQSATFANALATAAAGSMASIVGGYAMYGAIGISAGYGLAVNHLFRHEFNQILEQASDNRQKLSDALVWLQRQVRGGEKETELHKKWDQFASRTSEACCRFVRESVTPALLERLEAGDRDAIQKAESIIEEVQRANGKQLSKHYLLLAISILGIAAFVCGTIFTAGPFAPLFWAIGALLWLGIDSRYLNEKWGNFWCGKSLIPAAKIPMDPTPADASFDTQIPIARSSWIQPSPWLKTAGVAAAASAAAYTAGWRATGGTALFAAGTSLAIGAAAIYKTSKRNTKQKFPTIPAEALRDC